MKKKKEEKLFDAITNIPDDMIQEAADAGKKRPFLLRHKWPVLAACSLTAVGLLFFFPQPTPSPGGHEPHTAIGVENTDGTSSSAAETDPSSGGPDAPTDGSQESGFMDSPSSGFAGQLADILFPKALAYDDYDAKHQLLESNPVDETFISAVDAFSYETASAILSQSQDNVNYSPISLYYALAVAASGADGETAQELLSLLGVSDSQFLSQQCSNLYRCLYTENEMGSLKIANSLWMDRRYTWKDTFIQNAADHFYSASFSVNFSDGRTGKQMADWISEQTGHTLTPNLSLSREQILSILNTIYFKDQWITRFDTDKTASASFYPTDAAPVEWDFMNTTEYGSFVRGDTWVRASLQLKNGGSMVFVLPDEGISVRDLAATPEQTASVFQEGETIYGTVTWSIPKFQFSTSLTLGELVQSLGVTSAFRTDADFSGMTDAPAYFSSIRQDTYIGIDENGVEASSFTLINLDGSAMSDNEEEMILNRPFLYGITTPDGSLLFMGICENPAG